MHGRTDKAGQEFLRPLLAVLERRDTISAAERAALENLPWRLRTFPLETEVIAAGSRPEESCFIVSGFASRAVYLPGGGRQLTSIHVPGDFVDLHGLLLKEMDHSVIALTECTMAFAKHSALRKLSEKLPHLWRLLSLTAAIDGAIQRSWITSLGRRGSTERLAHLICELCVRLEIVGAVSEGTFQLPLNQTRLADILGLSVVQTNRSLQKLRAMDLISWTGGMIAIVDRPKLAALAEFDDIYLNLLREPR